MFMVLIAAVSARVFVARDVLKAFVLFTQLNSHARPRFVK